MKPKNREGNPQEVFVFYYIVKATDGSRRKIMQYEEALFKYQQLIAFELRQLELPKVIEPQRMQTAFVLQKGEEK